MSPSFVSLFSLLVSVVLCWSVFFCRVMLTVQQSFACLPVFPPFGVFFCLSSLILIKSSFSCVWVLASSLSSCILTERISQYEDSTEEGFVLSTTRHYLQPPMPTHPPVPGPELLPSAGQWREEVCCGVQWCSRVVRVQWVWPQGPLQQCPWWAPQLVADEGAGPLDIWGICGVFAPFQWTGLTTLVISMSTNLNV